jgi:hypothetical protein
MSLYLILLPIIRLLPKRHLDFISLKLTPLQRTKCLPVAEKSVQMAAIAAKFGGQYLEDNQQ